MTKLRLDTAEDRQMYQLVCAHCQHISKLGEITS